MLRHRQKMNIGTERQARQIILYSSTMIPVSLLARPPPPKRLSLSRRGPILGIAVLRDVALLLARFKIRSDARKLFPPNRR